MTLRNTIFELWNKKELELGRELKLREVSEAIGISIDTVHRAKTNKTPVPNEETLNALCKYFDCPPGYVVIVYEPD